MIDYDTMLDARAIEQDLYSPISAIRAYSAVLKNPEILGEFSPEQAIRLYAIFNHSQRTHPKFYQGFDKKPDNGFLNFLIANHPGLDDSMRDEAIRTAECFTDYDMIKIQRGEASPFDYQVRLLKNGSVGETPKNYGNKSVIQGYKYFETFLG